MILAILIGAAVFGTIIAALISSHGECPREIYGYHCKGKACDHSEESIHEAKRDMGLL